MLKRSLDLKLTEITGEGYDADDARPTFVWGDLSVFEAFPGQFHGVSVGRWVAQGREV